MKVLIRLAIIVALAYYLHHHHGMQTKLVEVGVLQTYTCKNLFSLNAPAAWQRKEIKYPGQTVVEWLDATGNGAIVVRVVDARKSKSPEALLTELQQHTRQIYAHNADFSTDAGDVASGGLHFNYKSLNGTVKMIGSSHIHQSGSRVSVFTYLVPAEQFSRLEAPLQGVEGSLKVVPKTP